MLSTGVDARNIHNIILMRPANSMIEFKQIIGRGTRLYDGKDYFTIYDFVEAYKNLQDDEWDGEPMDPVVPLPKPPTSQPEPMKPSGEGVGEDGSDEGKRSKRIKIKLADGKERMIDSMIATSFWNPDGTPMSASEFLKRLFGDLPDLFKDEDELRKLWSKPDTRKDLIQSLDEKGYGMDELSEMRRLIQAEQSDLYDVLAYVAYASPTITREERVDGSKAAIFAPKSDKQKDFLAFVLEHYIREGVLELGREKLPDLLELKYHSVPDAVQSLGEVKLIRELFVGFQEHLYEARTA